MNILAIDQARKGAWSVYEYETKKLIACDSYFFDTKKYTYAKAIMYTEDLVAELVESYNIKAVFIEDIQLRGNPQSYKKLAQLQGVLINFFERNELTYGLIAPTQWQNFCRSIEKNLVDDSVLIPKADYTDVKESKQLSMRFVSEQLGINTDDDNLADSICIGYYVVSEIKI